MVDDNSGNFATKDELKLLFAQFEQKLSDRDVAHKKELELQANQIHSSYLKKMKKLNLETPSQTSEEDDEVSTETPSRRPTKREVELQNSVEKLLKELDDTRAREKNVSIRQRASEQIIKGGAHPKSVNNLLTLWQAQNALSEGEDGSLRLKVNVEGSTVSLPFDDGLKRFLASEDGEIFRAPSGVSGSGSKTPMAPGSSTSSTSSSADDDSIPLYRRYSKSSASPADWEKIAKDTLHKGQ